MIMGHKY